MNKTILLLVLVVATVGCAFGRPQYPSHGHRPHDGGFGGAPSVCCFAGPQGNGGAKAAGINNGQTVVGNQTDVGTGTGIANPGPGGFGIGLGVGGAVTTPLGNLAYGEGQSISVGK